MDARKGTGRNRQRDRCRARREAHRGRRRAGDAGRPDRLRRAAGLADRERAAPMREDAVFRLASLTKPLVTAAALRMAELGRIALADPVTRYLPDFRPALPNGEVPAITLRHLRHPYRRSSYASCSRRTAPISAPGVRWTGGAGLSIAKSLSASSGRDLQIRRAKNGNIRSPWSARRRSQVVEGADIESVRRYVSAPLGAAR